jgi:flagellin-like protein
MMREKKGISPVVATVILIAVAVSIAIGVAFWASSLAGSFSRTEIIKMDNSYIDSGINSTDGATYYNISISMRNVGSADTTITQTYINGKPLKVFWSISAVYVNSNLWIDSSDTDFKAISLPTGSSITILIMLPSGQPPSQSPIIPGEVLEIRMETITGIHYIGTFVLS